MAAGLGFKDFATGEVLTAADVDGYLMQGVWVFASAAARDAAVTSPQEGNFAYLKDTNVTTYYTGSAWANLDTTGMTNPMTTTGDMIYSSSGSTPARLGIGTAGQVLKVNSGATAPEWGAAGGASGLTKITSASFSAVSSFNIDNIFTATYKRYMVIFSLSASSSATLNLRYRVAGVTKSTSDFYGSGLGIDRTNASVNNGQVGSSSKTISTDATGVNLITMYFTQVGNSSQKPFFTGTGVGGGSQLSYFFGATFDVADTYDGLHLFLSANTMTGDYQVFGLEN